MQENFSFMFYNTENLYDTTDDPEIMDDEFTPGGKLRWDEKRLDDKVGKIAHVIAHITAPDAPSIIGLAEIENKGVIERLLDALKREHITGYGSVHYDSPDERGSDVALLYDTGVFRVRESFPIPVHLDGIEERTRDILHVAGTTKNDAELHLFITHFPSRREGREKSERRRYVAAGELRNETDKVFLQDPRANIVILGDFNDTPDDNSISDVLGARKSLSDIAPAQLYNLLYPKQEKGLGTTFHERWLLFDQIIVSGGLLLSDKIGFDTGDADIYNPRYLLHFDKKGNPSPNRTYRRGYTGGYSDHLPVFLKTRLK